MTKFLLLSASFLVAGCATVDETPAIEIRTVEVVVEVEKPCPGSLPARPAPLERPLPTDLGQLALVLGAKLAEYSDPGNYADRADALMARCVTTPD